MTLDPAIIRGASAILEAWYGGQEAGSAIVDTLFGACGLAPSPRRGPCCPPLLLHTHVEPPLLTRRWPRQGM